MNLVKIGNTIINTDLLSSVMLDESAELLIVQTSVQKLSFPLDDTARNAYEWLVAQCVVTFETTEEPKSNNHGLTKSAWAMLLRIERHEQRTGLLGLPIDDDDMDTTIELERKSLIKTDVHNAWLTEQGRTLLMEHRAEESEETQEETES